MVKNWCWNYYDGDVKRAKCKYCPQSYVGGYVERMQKHLLACNKIPAEIKLEIKQKYSKEHKKHQPTTPNRTPSTSRSASRASGASGINYYNYIFEII
jgi:hypothetical protein